MADFFSKEWADAVRDALTAGPDEQARAVKLQEYWDFFDFLKSIYPASWALGCRDRGSYLFVQWHEGTVTDCRIIGPDDPLQATYVLGMDYRDWKALHDGYDAQRTVMYRTIMLEQGDLLLRGVPRRRRRRAGRLSVSHGARPSSGPKERSTCSASASGCHGPVPTIRTTGSGLLYSETSYPEEWMIRPVIQPDRSLAR